MKKSEGNSDNRMLEAFQACRDSLVRSIMKMCAHQQDVDDILQETFLRVLDSNRKRQIKSPQDYFFVVSRNLVLKGLSRQSREIITEIDQALIGADENSADIELHYRRKFEAFNTALISLPEKHRRAILLRKFYGLSHREIAKKMGVSLSSIEKYISSGIKQCKQNLASQGYDSESGFSTSAANKHPSKGSSAVEE